RATVSKTVCCWFESNQACKVSKRMIGKVQKFVSEVAIELKKVSWSTRKDLVDATWIVFLSSVLLGVFIGATDFVLSKLLEIIIG
ncbi:MAG: preprotein translocase subunit SecE, partial [Candidatus Omnitrophica bacterium]|nr:preprotein translocase subunit SecE [Candidatus Omnitrophota bacterium]